MVTPNGTYQVPSSVVREVLSDDELVVLDTLSRRFYSLNTTCKRIYELAAEGLSAAAIAAKLGAEFDVGPDECEPDVLSTLTDLLERGLLVSLK